LNYKHTEHLVQLFLIMALINGGGEIVIGGYQDFGTRVLDLLAIVLVELVQNIKVKLIYFLSFANAETNAIEVDIVCLF
jgi:hypothetical protein